MAKDRIRQPGEDEHHTRCNCCGQLVEDTLFTNHWASCPMRQWRGFIEPVIVSPS